MGIALLRKSRLSMREVALKSQEDLISSQNLDFAEVNLTWAVEAMVTLIVLGCERSSSLLIVICR